MSRQSYDKFQNQLSTEENVLRKYLACIPGGDISLIPNAVEKSQATHLHTFQLQAQQALLLQQQQKQLQQQQIPHLDTFEEEESSCSTENDGRTNIQSLKVPCQQFNNQLSQSLPFSYNSPALTRLIINNVIEPLNEPSDSIDIQLHLLHMRNLAEEQEKTIQRALIEGEKSKFSKKAAEFDKFPREEPQKYSSIYYSKQLNLQQQYISNNFKDVSYPQQLQDNQNILGSKSTNGQYSQKISSKHINSTTTSTSRASKSTIIDQNFLQPRSQNLLYSTNQLTNTQTSSISKINTSNKGNISQLFQTQIPPKQPLLLSSFSSPSSSSSTNSTLNKRRHLSVSTSSSLRTSNTIQDNLQSDEKENNSNVTVKLVNKITKDNKNKKKNHNNLIHNHNNNHSHNNHSQSLRQPSQLQANNTHSNLIAFSPQQQSITPLSLQRNHPQQPQQHIIYDQYNPSQSSQQQISQQQSIFFGNNLNNTMNPTINHQIVSGYYYSQPQQSAANILSGDYPQPNDYHNYKQVDVFEGQEALTNRGTANNIINNNSNLLNDSNLPNSHQMNTSNGFEEMFFCSMNDSDTIVQLQHQSNQIVSTNISTCPERYSNQQRQHNRVQQDQQQQQQQQKQSQISLLNRMIQPNSVCNHAAANLEEVEDMLNNYLA